MHLNLNLLFENRQPLDSLFFFFGENVFSARRVCQRLVCFLPFDDFFFFISRLDEETGLLHQSAFREGEYNKKQKKMYKFSHKTAVFRGGMRRWGEAEEVLTSIVTIKARSWPWLYVIPTVFPSTWLAFPKNICLWRLIERSDSLLPDHIGKSSSIFRIKNRRNCFFSTSRSYLFGRILLLSLRFLLICFIALRYCFSLASPKWCLAEIFLSNLAHSHSIEVTFRSFEVALPAAKVGVNEVVRLFLPSSCDSVVVVVVPSTFCFPCVILLAFFSSDSSVWFFFPRLGSPFLR